MDCGYPRCDDGLRDGAARGQSSSSARRQRYATPLLASVVDRSSCLHPRASGRAHSLCMPQLGAAGSTWLARWLMDGSELARPSRDRRRRRAYSRSASVAGRTAAEALRQRRAPWITRRLAAAVLHASCSPGTCTALHCAARFYLKKLAGAGGMAM